MSPFDPHTETMYNNFADILDYLGYSTDGSDVHLARTPERYIQVLKDYAGKDYDPDFQFTVFPNPNAETQSEMIMVGPITFYTFCAHHVLPFFGHAYVAYVPEDTVCGLSKLVRTVKHLSRGLSTQEDLTSDIAEYLQLHLNPLGVAVVMRARHLCMEMRGVQEFGVETVTSEMRGCFLDPTKQARQEFFAIVNKS